MKILFRWLGAAVLLSGAAFFLSDYHNDVYRKMLLWVTLALGYNFLIGGSRVIFSSGMVVIEAARDVIR